MRHLLRVGIVALCVIAYPVIDCAAAGCPPSPALRIDEVADLGCINPPSPVRYRDGGYSVFFDGRSTWVFGDTFFKPLSSKNLRFHSNSWSWTRDLDAHDGIGPFEHSCKGDRSPFPLLPFTDAEKAFNHAHETDRCRRAPCGARWALWPGAVVADPFNSRMLLFYEKVYVEPGQLNFTVFGYSVATWQNPDTAPQRVLLRPGQKHPTLMFSRDEPGFGDAACTVGRMLYVYGCSRDGSQVPCRVARVDLKYVLEKKHWQTWTAGRKWRKDLSAGRWIFNGNEILSVSYNPYLGHFIAVYSQPLSTAVMLRTALKPEGPWSEPIEAFRAKPPVNRIGWIYDALEHPEYRQDNGRLLYITYSRQTGAASFETRLVSLRIERVE